jgi:L-alanine-DL-glutamate epimerase-like enolase superfamily enzyme
VQDVVVAEKLWHKDGWTSPIHGPGLGIEVIETEVRKIAP